MNKKCVLLTDNENKPIRVLEIKEYTSKELSLVIENCELNLKNYEERVLLEKHILLRELELKSKQISELTERLNKCEEQIKVLLGEDE
jgi:hypothetical protein